MNIDDIVKGLQLIQKYKPAGESDFHVRAEHDEIIAGSLEWPISEADKKTLEDELGWTPIEDYDGWGALV